MTVKKTGSVLLVAIVALSIFVSLSVLVKQVPDSSVPDILSPVWNYIQSFFGLAPVITAIAFSVNISGFLINYFDANHSEEYDFNALGKTLALYIGIITSMISSAKTIAVILPAPYNEYVSAAITIGAAVIVILDLARKQLEELAQRMRAA